MAKKLLKRDGEGKYDLILHFHFFFLIILDKFFFFLTLICQLLILIPTLFSIILIAIFEVLLYVSLHFLKLPFVFVKLNLHVIFSIAHFVNPHFFSIQFCQIGHFGQNLAKSGQTLGKDSQPRGVLFSSNENVFLKLE
jgi:hypothetical protein